MIDATDGMPDEVAAEHLTARLGFVVSKDQVERDRARVPNAIRRICEGSHGAVDHRTIPLDYASCVSHTLPMTDADKLNIIALAASLLADEAKLDAKTARDPATQHRLATMDTDLEWLRKVVAARK